MRFLLAIVVVTAAVTSVACGGRPPIPKHGVVESNVGHWRYARAQHLMDIEVWVANNPAEAYTVSYTNTKAEARGRLADTDIVNAFVTIYQKPDGVVRETVKLARRLAAEKGYRVDETKIDGTRVLTIQGESEAWVMWPAKLHVVKLGGVGRTSVPEDLVGKYGEIYESLLPGGSLEGALPPGPDDPKPAEKPEYDPSNPHPDLEKYDPKKVKLP